MSRPEIDDIDDFPPSARYIVYVLEDADGSIGRDELLERTGLPERTTDKALARLEEATIIRRERNGDDLRFVRVELVN